MKAFFVVVVPIVIGIIGLAFNWWSFKDPTSGSMLKQTEEQTRLLRELVTIQRDLMNLTRDNSDVVNAIKRLEDRIASLEAGGERSETEAELEALRKKEQANRERLEELQRKVDDLEERLREAGYTDDFPPLPEDPIPTEPAVATATPWHDTAEPSATPRATAKPKATKTLTPQEPVIVDTAYPTPEEPTPLPPATPMPQPTAGDPDRPYPGPPTAPPDHGDTVPEPSGSLPTTPITEANAGRLQTWQVLYSTGFVESVAFGDSSRDLYWSGANGYWDYDLQDMRLYRHDQPYSGQVHSLVPLPGLGLLSAGVDAAGAMVSASLKDGHVLWQLKVGDAPWGARAIASQSGEHIATNSAGEVRVWRYDANGPRGGDRIDGWCGPAFLGDDRIVTWLDGPRIHTLDGMLVAFAPGRSSSGYSPGMSVSPDGSLIAGGDTSGAAPLWTSDDLTPVRTLYGHTDFIQATTFSPDGSILATSSEDRTVRVWRVRDGEPLALLEGFGARAQSLAFSPDGAILAAGALDGQIRLWSIGD